VVVVAAGTSAAVTVAVMRRDSNATLKRGQISPIEDFSTGGVAREIEFKVLSSNPSTTREGFSDHPG
jgi:hypothetical protein